MPNGQNTGRKKKHPTNTNVRSVFLLGQPLFRLVERRPEARWHAVINEAEPRDDRRKGDFTPALRPPTEAGTPDPEHTWRRLDREELVVRLADPLPEWHRVALVCGAGLGKTTNLQWLEAALNRHANHRGKQLAFFLEIKDLPDSPARLMQFLCTKKGARNLKHALRDKRRQGQITLLLDSLDQAGARPEDPAIRSLQTLLSSVWSPCPIWVSGRPHAFEANRTLFLPSVNDWQFLRVGQLDEPECRFLLDETQAEARQFREGT